MKRFLLRGLAPICAAFLLAATSAVVAAPERVVLPADVLDQVFTLDEAARYLRVPPAELESLAQQGAIPGRKLSGDWRFSRISLLQWLNHDRPLRIEAVPKPGDTNPSTAMPLGRLDLAGVSGRGVGGAPAGAAVAQGA